MTYARALAPLRPASAEEIEEIEPPGGGGSPYLELLNRRAPPAVRRPGSVWFQMQARSFLDRSLYQWV